MHVRGKSVAEAFNSLYFLEPACQTQVSATSTGKPRHHVAPAVVERTRAQFADTGLPAGHNAYDYHFTALERLLDRRDPDYAD